VNHADHVGLLRAGLDGVAPGERWADVGAGSGAFTLALADVLGPGASIVAVDRDARALRANAHEMAARFPDVAFETRGADFQRPLDLTSLDGIVAANSLHFVPRERQVEIVRQLVAMIRPGGRLLVVEYDADRGNPWVPHPFSVATWQRMAAEAGLRETFEIGRVPSRFLGAIYSAASRV
jgi:ubiquinone/menaquinone biosynthesis C-methylase UbiE